MYKKNRVFINKCNMQFKGKRKDNGEWIYGSLISECWIGEYFDISTWIEGSYAILRCKAYEVIPETVEQLR